MFTLGSDVDRSIALGDKAIFFLVLCMYAVGWIAGEAYAWTAVFVLPVNSATNPLIYTIASLRFRMFLLRIGLARKKHSLSISKVLSRKCLRACYQPEHDIREFALADAVRERVFSLLVCLVVTNLSASGTRGVLQFCESYGSFLCGDKSL